MTAAVHLDHDFPYEPTIDFVHAGDVDGAPVYRTSTSQASVGAARLPMPAGAVQPAGDEPSSPSRPPAGESDAALVLGAEIAEYRQRSELLGQLVDLLAPSGIWKSFFLGITRRHHVERLEELNAEVLHTVVEQAHQVAAAKGGR